LVARSEEVAENVTRRQVDVEPLLTPAEVADLFGVDSVTVTRWARSGRLSAVRTLGGHRRFREREVRLLLSAARGPFRPGP
jgi:excisionase family DNA binding protein